MSAERWRRPDRRSGSLTERADTAFRTPPQKTQEEACTYQVHASGQSALGSTSLPMQLWRHRSDQGLVVTTAPLRAVGFEVNEISVMVGVQSTM